MRPDRLAEIVIAVLFASAAVTWDARAVVYPVTAWFLWRALRGHAAQLQAWYPDLPMTPAVERILAWSRVAVVGLMGAYQAVAIAVVHGAPIDEAAARVVLLGVFFVGLAVSFPFLPRNPWFGIRTGWTERSERAWRSTHRVGAVTFALLGGLVAAAGAGSWVRGLAVLIVGGVVNLLFVLVWSWRAWTADPEREA